MKKFIAAMIACIMLITACACAMENPWKETNGPALGYLMNVPEDAENVSYRVDESAEMVEMTFTIDDQEYTFRMKADPTTDGIVDISGMNYDWTYEEECEVCNRPALLLQAPDGENTVEVVIWMDVVPGFAYSLSTIQSDVNGLDLTAIAEQIFVEMQGDA